MELAGAGGTSLVCSLSCFFFPWPWERFLLHPLPALKAKVQLCSSCWEAKAEPPPAGAALSVLFPAPPPPQLALAWGGLLSWYLLVLCVVGWLVFFNVRSGVPAC